MMRLLTILILSGLSLNAAIPVLFTRPGTNAGSVVVTNCITPTPYNAPYAYWPLDEIDPVSPDVANGFDLTPPGTSNVTVTNDGIINNAVLAENPVGPSVEWLVAASGSEFRAASLAGDGQSCGFTARAWSYPNGPGKTLFGGSDWGLTAVLGENKYAFSLFTTTGLFIVTNDVTHDPLEWNHVVGWYDPVNSQIGICVNNESRVTKGITGIVTNMTPVTLEVGNGGVNAGNWAMYDEAVIWRGRVLTSLNVTTDYNSGAGRTYPLP